jgi:hypothetical protein
MPAKEEICKDSTFMVVGFNDKGRIAAATYFHAAPEGASRMAKERAFQSGFRKFQVYQIEVGDGQELKFAPVK